MPLPKIGEDLRSEIYAAAETILEVRSRHADEALADMYDSLTPERDLMAAHKKLDKLADAAFGAPKYLGDGEAADNARLDLLFGNYRRLTE